MSYKLIGPGEPIKLPPLPDEAGKLESHRERVLGVLREMLGPEPADVPVSYSVVGERSLDDHTRQHIRYATDNGDEVPAYLLLPRGYERADPGSLSAMIALHQTVPQGKDEVVGIDSRPNLAYGLELVRRGYVVLAPDVITAGERVYEGRKPHDSRPFYSAFPEWSALGKMLHDHRQGVSLLCSLERVNPERIAAIGHSLGGYNSIVLAAFDERVRATVSTCGFCTFAGDPRPNRWSTPDFPFSHMSRLTAYLERREIPFEWNEVVSLIAPRAFFNWSTQHDHIFPHWEGAAHAMAGIADWYATLGADDAFVSYIGKGPHDFPPPVRTMAYEFIDRQLAVPLSR